MSVVHQVSLPQMCPPWMCLACTCFTCLSHHSANLRIMHDAPTCLPFTSAPPKPAGSGYGFAIGRWGREWWVTLLPSYRELTDSRLGGGNRCGVRNCVSSAVLNVGHEH